MAKPKKKKKAAHKPKKKASRKAKKKSAARRRPSKKSKAKKSKARRSRARRRSRKATRLLRAMRSRRRGRMKRTASAALRRIRKLRPAERKTAQAMGLMKKARRNPEGVLGFIKSEAADMMALAPSMAVQLGAMAAIGYAGSKATEQIRKSAAPTGAVHKYAGAISSAAITVAAFAGMKMMKQDGIRKFALPVLMGGMAATIVNVLAAVKVKKDAAEISLGQRLGLPIGEYMALSGYLDVHGQQLAVDGFGEYVGQSLGAIDISSDQYGEGTVLGDYAAESLGEIGQMSEGRQGARALNSAGDMRVESFIDSGSLSGSVFD